MSPPTRERPAPGGADRSTDRQGHDDDTEGTGCRHLAVAPEPGRNAVVLGHLLDDLDHVVGTLLDASLPAPWRLLIGEGLAHEALRRARADLGMQEWTP